jgi:OmpA-OmpF porin, OOP family
MRSAWNWGRAVAAVLPLLVASLAGRRASAEDCHPSSGLSPCIDADSLWPHAGGGSYFAIGDASTTPAGKIAFGIVGSYLTKTIGLRVASADPAGSNVYLIDQAFDATLLFALGVTDRLEITLAAPATLYESGAGLAAFVGTASPPAHSAIRDARFGLAFTILERPRAGPPRGPALTARLEFDAPTGSDDTFAHGPTAAIAPSLAFSYRIGRVDLAAELDARLRGEAAFADAVMGTQIGGALGASVDILKHRWLSAGAEAFALPTTAKQLPDPRTGATSPLVPAEWIAHASTAHFLGGDLVLSLGGGGAIPTGSRGALTAPAYRLDFAIRLAPTGDHAGDLTVAGPSAGAPQPEGADNPR